MKILEYMLKDFLRILKLIFVSIAKGILWFVKILIEGIVWFFKKNILFKIVKWIIIGILAWPWLLIRCLFNGWWGKFMGDRFGLWYLTFCGYALEFMISFAIFYSIKSWWIIGVVDVCVRILETLVAVFYYRVKKKLNMLDEQNKKPKKTKLAKPDLSHIWDPVKTESEKKESEPFPKIWERKEVGG